MRVARRDGRKECSLWAGLGIWIESSEEPVRRAMARFTEQKGRFAATARRLMAEWGLTQEQLAQQVGVTQPTVSDILAGKHKPQPKTLGRLADALAVTVEALWPAA
jgi:DNA-binding XRE family transcriptional regulator